MGIKIAVAAAVAAMLASTGFLYTWAKANSTADRLIACADPRLAETSGLPVSTSACER
jgi:hypothetical protein